MHQKLFSAVFEEIRMVLGQTQDGVECLVIDKTSKDSGIYF